MKKTILMFLLIAATIFSLVGCAECMSTEYENVEVNIVDEYYRAMWLQPVVAGKVTTIITHPAQYNITVEYNGIEYSINDSYTYKKYEDKVGQTAIGTLEICTYDDGSVKYDIISLE